jgi:hypothetical protein
MMLNIFHNLQPSLVTGGYCSFCEQKEPKKLSGMLSHSMGYRSQEPWGLLFWVGIFGGAR